MRFSGFARVMAYWVQRADPDGSERTEEDKVAGRRLHLSRSMGGVWFGDFTLDPISGTIVSDALERVENELFQRDWNEARERLGREPVVTDLPRTAAQRRADALVG